MSRLLFIAVIGTITSLYLSWGFRNLTRENRQILASMPGEKMENGFWKGVNFTWYGLLCANSILFSAALYLVLSASVGVPVHYSLPLMAILLSILLPSARWIARFVEKKKHTFTVGGSVFAGIVLAPLMIIFFNAFLSLTTGFNYPVAGVLASMAVSYAFGESLGRLSCISFGCCYGKALTDVHPFLRKIFRRHPFVFTGHTRKACYASGLEGVETLPVQAVTSVIYAVSGTVGLAMFLWGSPGAALLETLLVTQVWRVLSEFLREDDRGSGRLSAYQIMGLAASLVAVCMVCFIPGMGAGAGDIGKGLRVIWNPWVLVILQGLWFLTFVYMGRSTVTYAHMEFHVEHERL
jgi:hypothetical protein